MATNNGNDPKRRIGSLSELSQDVQPPRDLWPSISAEIAKDAKGATNATKAARPYSQSRVQWFAAAAVIAALAVGIWIGRAVLPGSTNQSTPQVASNANNQDVIAAAYVRDPRYLKHRAELMRAVDEKMKTLPPETQKKVSDSLATIRKSITDIQVALGSDPGNALLQELLVSSYQDEMRVLTTVTQAGPRQEI